jgi:hypothetical protein
MTKCDYCGREYEDATQPCPGCGTPPACDADRVKGEPSRPVSVGGLLECAVGVARLAVGDFAGAIHLAGGLSKLDQRPDDNSPHRLLGRAAALESSDTGAAIALYQRIARDYPGTSAGKEASRNLLTLRAAHPDLRL